MTTSPRTSNDRLGIGFVGSGFITRFHVQSLVHVRDADVAGITSPNREHAESTARLARSLDVGAARVFDSLEAMVADESVDAVWICGPNHTRVENVEAVCRAVEAGAKLRGIACEKPLARNVAEARRLLARVESVGLRHAYLEDQVFAPVVVRGKEILWRRGAVAGGRPYLARAAEEHSGPHKAWFWQGELQGGGVLNDMMCHSIEVARHLLTEPGAPRSSLRPRRIGAHIACLKWGRAAQAEDLARRFGSDVDYRRRPAEDYAHAIVEFEDAAGHALVAEVSTSWCYDGPGLRLRFELLGPGYSMTSNSLESGLSVFFGRELGGAAGEDLVEKQNAESGAMPVVADEASFYGYAAENRHVARALRDGTELALTFADGVQVLELLMTAYRSAELGRTLDFDPAAVADFVPAVARGSWRPAGPGR